MRRLFSPPNGLPPYFLLQIYSIDLNSGFFQCCYSSIIMVPRFLQCRPGSSIFCSLCLLCVFQRLFFWWFQCFHLFIPFSFHFHSLPTTKPFGDLFVSPPCLWITLLGIIFGSFVIEALNF